MNIFIILGLLIFSGKLVAYICEKIHLPAVTGMIALGIKGAQVFDSTNVSAKITLNFPFLSMLASKNEQISSKILFGVVESETIASRLYAHMKKEGININDAGAGILYTFPFGAVYGGIDIDYS